MFRGVNALNLDSKGRLAIPTRYREELLRIANGQVDITGRICLMNRQKHSNHGHWLYWAKLLVGEGTTSSIVHRLKR